MKSKYHSKVIIGTWSLSGDFGKISKKNIYSSLEQALKKNFFEYDTAPTYGYGSIETVLSEICKGDKRIKINTKCGYNSLGTKTFAIDDIKKSIDQSLKKFEKINTLFLHNPRTEIKNWSLLINFLLSYKKKKYINNIGISLARDYYFNKKIMNSFDFIQDEINLLRPQAITKLKNFKPKIMARSPLASGCLSEKLTISSKFSKNDYRKSWLGKKTRLKHVLFQIEEIKKITGKNLRSFSKIFLIKEKNINKVIFGIKNPSHINEIEKDLNNLTIISQKQKNLILNLAKKNFNLPMNFKGY
jgi:aryl-alcohol dehydrogenase-like predicted oxidoreductase